MSEGLQIWIGPAWRRWPYIGRPRNRTALAFYSFVVALPFIEIRWPRNNDKEAMRILGIPPHLEDRDTDV